MRPFLLLTALFALCGILWLALADPDAKVEVHGTATASAPVQATGAPLAEPAAVEGSDSLEVRIPASIPAPDYPKADRDLDLHGVVVLEDSSPVAGAVVEIEAVPGRGFHGLDIPETRRRKPIASVRTDRLGRFAVRVERDRPHDLTAVIPGWVAPCARTRYAGEFVRIVASPAAALKGRVARASDSSGVPEVPVRWFLLGAAGSGGETRTDAEGNYSFHSLPAARVMLEVRPPVLRPPEWTEVVLQEGVDTVLDFSLEAGQTVFGRIIDSRTGEGIAGAEVTDSWVFHRVFRSDAQGNYRLTGLYCNREFPFQLYARAEAFGKWSAKLNAFDGDEFEFNIRLDPERRLKGRVIDATGAPIGGAYVAAVSSVRARIQKSDWISGKTAEDGGFELGRLRRDLPHAILIRKAGFGTRLFELPPEEGSLDVIELPDLILHPAAIIRGQLVDGTQAGVPGANVLIEGHNIDRDRFNHREIRGLASSCEGRSARTDDLGRFFMTDLSGGNYTISIKLPSRRGVELGTIELQDGELRDDLLYEFQVGLNLNGVVKNEAGEPVETANLILVPLAGGERRWTWSRVDGSFEFLSLPDTEYRLVCCQFLARDSPETHHFAATTVEGTRAGGPPLEIILRSAAPIRGRLLASGGNSVAGMELWVEIAPGEKLKTRTKDDGSFEFRVGPGKLFDVYVNPPRSQPGLPKPSPILLGIQILSGTEGLTLILPTSE